MKKHAYKNLPSSCSSFSHYSPQIRQVKQLARNRHEQQFSLFVRMKFINLHHKKATTMTTRKVFKSKTQRIWIRKNLLQHLPEPQIDLCTIYIFISSHFTTLCLFYLHSNFSFLRHCLIYNGICISSSKHKVIWFDRVQSDKRKLNDNAAKATDNCGTGPY